VDDIACHFEVPRSSLNVTAAAKGLVAGAVKLFRRNEDAAVDARADREGMLIHGVKDILYIEMPAVKWILVIEKEATFRSIASSPFWSTILEGGIILTGKGYPDLATRTLLRLLSTPSVHNSFAHPAVYGLADFDPDGLAILSVYKHGSKALSHESEGCIVPQLQWIGLQSQHLDIAGDITHAAQGLLALTCHDRQKATKMLEREVVSCSSGSTLEGRELQVMLMLGLKAELQLLDSIPHGMVDLLKSVIREA
jgi:meiotic recombination protein SPO11